MKILVLNSGSSSIKYSLFDMIKRSVIASGAVERIGEKVGAQRHKLSSTDTSVQELSSKHDISTHKDGLGHIMTLLQESGILTDPNELFCIGHRVVHGGELFREPTRVNEKVITEIRKMIPLAPLHNPANLMGIEVAMQVAPRVPQVAVFDTAFHHTIPPHAYRYALPHRFYTDQQVRRYGFHGTSHHYVAKRAAQQLGRPLDSVNLITLHLGNGASAAAIQQGKSIDTSMGMTPLEGLIMGTRCGDMDPSIHFYLQRTMGLSSEELETLLNKESGLKGICGANDMREVHRLADAGDEQAVLALDMYCYRIKKYIGAYYAALGQLDAIVFTGGIGENDARVRADCCSGLAGLGIQIDKQRNLQTKAGISSIHADDSRIAVLVVPTDEELEIAIECVACLQTDN